MRSKAGMISVDFAVNFAIRGSQRDEINLPKKRL
jgi:hypothetical protein